MDDPARPLYETDPANWVVLLVTLFVVVICVGIHFEAMQLIVSRVVKREKLTRRTILFTMFGLLGAHLVEIGLFGVAMSGLLHQVGERAGAHIGNYDGFGDNFYFSATVYTTVGFGDITPEGPLRTLVGLEALTGLVLITWSASFTFVLMQRYVRDRYGEGLG